MSQTEENTMPVRKHHHHHDPVHCIRKHPIPVIIAAFLGGIGAGMLIIHGIGRGQAEKKSVHSEGGIISFLFKIGIMFVLDRLMKTIRGNLSR